MKFKKYIVAFITLITCSSCSLNELEEPVAVGDSEGNSSVEVYARITNFSDKTVDTRSAKSPEEAVVSSMALAVFPIEVDGDGNPIAIRECVDYYFEVGQKVSFTIERTDDVYNNTEGKPYAMYIFANVPNMPTRESENWKGMTIDDFVALTHDVEPQDYGNADYPGLPDTGFPMMGSLGDNVSGDTYGNMYADDKSLILKPIVSTKNPHALPLVNGEPTDLLNIPMQALYAKVSFNISVNPMQTVDVNTQSFTMESFTLHNIPSTVDFDLTTNSDTEVLAVTPTISNHSTTVEGASGEGAIKFSFYIPERYLTAPYSANPDDTNSDETPYTVYYPYYPFDEDGSTLLPEEKDKLRQRYKPLLLGDSGKQATYVTIKGKYLDHNARTWTVTYDIYLGADNCGDFNIIRNNHYINNISILGLDNSVSQPAGSISIDHRVNVESSLPIIESLRRETLLDSHFEVRPLRIRALEGYDDKKITVSVQPVNDGDNVPDWIRLEHMNSALNTDTYLPSGKRKYFTTDLVTNTLKNADMVKFNSQTSDNDCIWIYVDECTDIYDPSNANDDPVRSAKIVIEVEGQTSKAEYIINQSKLYKIPYPDDPDKYYLIESYEEYLYNYDAEDTYTANKTFYEGMKWGLDGEQLSHTLMAALPSSLENYGSLNPVRQEQINGWVDSYYDFYNERHDSDIVTPDEKHIRAGQNFCDAIINYVGIDVNIDQLTLDGMPTSAVEYCYNKNKRNGDGLVASGDWYLPAIDEMEDIMVGAYDAFDGVFQSQDYWSCQPSYHRCYFFMSKYYDRVAIGNFVFNEGTLVRGNFDFYIDDTNRARSTRAIYGYDEDTQVYKYSYNPSGVVIPEAKQEDRKLSNGNTVRFTIQGGYYTWRTNRGGENVDDGYDENGIWTDYDYVGAYISSDDVNKRIYPEFGEEQESGNMDRDTKNRIRCVYKRKEQVSQ